MTRTQQRIGLLFLAIAALVVGLWALFAPESFYDDFPGGGRNWVSPLGPYNEHLVRDVGSLNLALAVLMGWAASSLDRRLVQGSLVVYLVNAVPHFFFHVFHLDELDESSDQVFQTVSLALLVVLPAFMLVSMQRGSRST